MMDLLLVVGDPDPGPARLDFSCYHWEQNTKTRTPCFISFPLSLSFVFFCRCSFPRSCGCVCWLVWFVLIVCDFVCFCSCFLLLTCFAFFFFFFFLFFFFLFSFFFSSVFVCFVCCYFYRFVLCVSVRCFFSYCWFLIVWLFVWNWMDVCLFVCLFIFSFVWSIIPYRERTWVYLDQVQEPFCSVHCQRCQTVFLAVKPRVKLYYTTQNELKCSLILINPHWNV